MIDPKPAARPSAFRVLLTTTVLLAGLAPLPAGWALTIAREQPPGSRARRLEAAWRLLRGPHRRQ